MEQRHGKHLRLKYEIPRKDRSCLPCSRDMRRSVKVFAINRHITMVEATYRLLIISLTYEMMKKYRGTHITELDEAADLPDDSPLNS